MSTPPSSRWSAIAVSAVVLVLACRITASAHEIAVPGPADWKQAQERARAAKFLTPDEAVGVTARGSGQDVIGHRGKSHCGVFVHDLHTR
jgi:hypothetical protein